MDIAIVAIAVAAILMVRNCVTFQIQGGALERCSKLAKRAIDTNQRDFLAAYRIYEKRGYLSIMFDPTCWTARQAHPELFESESPIKATTGRAK